MTTTGKLINTARVLAAMLLAVVLALCCATMVVGCTTGGSAAKRAKVTEIAERVWAYGQEHPDGFTVDVRTMEVPTEGIAVSYAATQDSHSREELERVVEHALRHDGYVGGWYNGENGLYYFDSTRLFPEIRLEDALRFGRDNGQHTVYLLSTGEEIPVGVGDPR